MLVDEILLMTNICMGGYSPPGMVGGDKIVNKFFPFSKSLKMAQNAFLQQTKFVTKYYHSPGGTTLGLGEGANCSKTNYLAIN